MKYVDLSVIVPTKNRGEDLVNFIKSLSMQSTLPSELIVVDQSDDFQHIDYCKKLIPTGIKLTYIHDKKISGLVEAKYVGYLMSSNDIICFLEDDLLLDYCFIEKIFSGFQLYPEMIGCSGLIVNKPDYGIFYRFFYNLFHRGMFYDPRITIGNKSSDKFTLCHILSGGISSWRAFVFDVVPFELNNYFFMLEDFDFSSRVHAKDLGPCFVNTEAKVTHLYSPVNRPKEVLRLKIKTKEYVLFYRLRKNSKFSFCSFLWLLFGLFFESIYKGVTLRSFNTIKMFYLGAIDGFKQKISADKVI